MAEKGWSENRNRGVSNSSTGATRNSLEKNIKYNQTQYVDCEQKPKQLTS